MAPVLVFPYDMVERKWSFGISMNGRVFINFQNILDVRHSRFEPLGNDSINQPNFVTDIYAPTNGRISNGGIKLYLYLWLTIIITTTQAITTALPY
ncbi:hypothetical protein [Spirosoma humi]